MSLINYLTNNDLAHWNYDLMAYKGLDLARIIGDRYPFVKSIFEFGLQMDRPVRSFLFKVTQKKYSQLQEYHACHSNYTTRDSKLDYTFLQPMIYAMEKHESGESAVYSMLHHWSYYKDFIKEVGYDQKQFQKIFTRINDPNDAANLGDLDSLLKLRSDFWWNALDIYNKGLTDGNFTMGDIPPRIAMKLPDFEPIFSGLVDMIQDDYVNLEEIGAYLVTFVKFLYKFVYGFFELFARSLIMLSEPIMRIIPNNPKSLCKRAKNIANIYSNLMNDNSIQGNHRQVMEDAKPFFSALDDFSNYKLDISKYTGVTNFFHNIKKWCHPDVPIIDIIIQFDTEASHIRRAIDIPQATLRTVSDAAFAYKISVDDNKYKTTDELWNVVLHEAKQFQTQTIPSYRRFRNFVIDIFDPDDISHTKKIIKSFTETAEASRKVNDLLKEYNMTEYDPTRLKGFFGQLVKVCEFLDKPEFSFLHRILNTAKGIFQNIEGNITSDMDFGHLYDCVGDGKIGRRVIKFFYIWSHNNQTLEEQEDPVYGIYLFKSARNILNNEDANFSSFMDSIIAANERGEDVKKIFSDLYHKFLENGDLLVKDSIDQLDTIKYDMIADKGLAFKDLLKLITLKDPTLVVTRFYDMIDQLSKGTLSPNTVASFSYGVKNEIYMPIIMRAIRKYIIIAACCAAALLILITTIIVYCCCFRKKKQNDESFLIPGYSKDIATDPSVNIDPAI